MNEQLFRIEILHSYFSNGLYQNCRVIPDSGTKKIIDRYQFLTSMNDGVFGFYTVFKDGALALVKYLDDQLRGEPLRFFLISNEQQFVLITDLPLDWVGQVALSSKSGVMDNTGNETKIQLKPVLSGRAVSQQDVIGVVSIYLDDLLAMDCENVRYVIHFQARTLHWLYYLINRSQTKLNNPMICNRNRVCFDEPEPVVLSNEERCLSFSSGEMQFPLQQVPTTMFDLVDRLLPSSHAEGQPVERCLIQGLPTPKEGELKVKQTAVNTYVFSEMYVYL